MDNSSSSSSSSSSSAYHSPGSAAMLPPTGFNRSARKRNASQAEVSFSSDQSFSGVDELVVESAVAVVFLMMNSTQLQISLLLKSLHKSDINDFNEAVSSVINSNMQLAAQSQQRSYGGNQSQL
jgi:hypothetical protein